MDIAVSAALSDLRGPVLVINVGTDTVDANDISYNKVFPYAATPLNGRNHGHHRAEPWIADLEDNTG